MGAIRIRDGTTRPVGLVFAPDGRTLYLANGRAHTVLVVP